MSLLLLLRSSATASLSFVSTVTTATNVNFTELGAQDWALWNSTSTLTPTNRKDTGGSLISALSYVVGTSHAGYTNAPSTFSWTDGTLTASGSTTEGIYTLGAGSGFSFTVPADTGKRTVRIYAAQYSGASRVTATLSDSSVTPISFTFASTAASTVAENYIEISYSANSVSQTLLIKYDLATDISGGNVAMRGVHLSAEAGAIIKTYPSFLLMML